MLSVSSRLRGAMLASAATLITSAVWAQSAPSPLPAVTIDAPSPQRSAFSRNPRQTVGGARTVRRVTPTRNASPASAGAGTAAPGSLTVLTAQQALAQIQQTPGGVAIVPDTAFKNGPANTVKDILGWVPGVLIQTRWGADGRVSIRGSGLSRSFGNRGINIFMDGIPLNTSDGLFDLFEVDPSVYRYVEVYKGANALRYGGNSLGGAINFVMPTGRDAPAFETRLDGGSFGYVKTQTSTAGVSGPADYFITASAQREDGYREHSRTDTERLNANFGYQFSPDAETRLYINAGRWRAQIPGEVTKTAALTNPRAADPEFVRQDQQRNIDTIRLANKTTLRFDNTLVDFGIFGLSRHVMHPIFQWIDFTAQDHGGFVRATDERYIGGFRNRLTAGVNVLNGTIDIKQYQNLTGAVKGALTSSNLWKSDNVTAYAENSFYVAPNVAFVTGGQFLHASRQQQDRFLSNGDESGTRSWDLFSPKVGVVWEVDPAWQVFGNISRNAEVPTFDVNTFSSPASSNVDAQTGITYEIGSRGRRPDVTWDLSLYRTNLRNEFQCLTTSPFSPCTVVNADRTVHQGVEAGLGVAFLNSTFVQEDRFWFNLAYTYGDFRFERDARWGNNRLPGAPPHYVRAEILYRHANGFYAGPNVEWMPQAFFADNANSLSVDPYALLNFKVGYDAGIGWSGYVEGRNLLDTRYISSTITAGIATASSALFNPGMGRAIYGGIRYRM